MKLSYKITLLCDGEETVTYTVDPHSGSVCNLHICDHTHVMLFRDTEKVALITLKKAYALFHLQKNVLEKKHLESAYPSYGIAMTRADLEEIGGLHILHECGKEIFIEPENLEAHKLYTIYPHDLGSLSA